MTDPRATTALPIAALVLITGALVALMPSETPSSAPTPSAPDAATPEPPARQVAKIEWLQGALEVHDGQWRSIAAGEEVIDPSAFRVAAADIAVIVLDETRMVLSDGAVVRTRGDDLYVERGRLVIRATSPVVVADGHARVVARTVAVWRREDRTIVATLDGQAEVETQGRSEVYAFGHELVITDDDVTLHDLPVALTVVVDSIRDRTVVGRTSPNAGLLKARGDSYLPVPVSPEGAFEAQIQGRKLGPSELVAVDCAGRSAEPGNPSPTVDDLLRWLDGDRSIQVGPTPATAKERIRWRPGSEAFRKASTATIPDAGPPPLFDFDVPAP